MKCREFGQKLHNKGSRNLYSSLITITKNKSRRVKRAGNVANMSEENIHCFGWKARSKETIRKTLDVGVG
jgi:hypothetical protein